MVDFQYYCCCGSLIRIKTVRKSVRYILSTVPFLSFESLWTSRSRQFFSDSFSSSVWKLSNSSSTTLLLLQRLCVENDSQCTDGLISVFFFYCLETINFVISSTTLCGDDSQCRVPSNMSCNPEIFAWSTFKSD